ncbi:prepilin-type N-terminal cleavage/methylation domain-containing protein [Candidatus Saccharibacteria bacterium]|nr:MAG: prepilin-type N-terminal cleavage/methylation domain-containing protein [Candidatus Saccharibacteria bacterium]
MKRGHTTQPAFTIIELLIVIIIIAILAAITIVAFNGVQRRANTSSAQSSANSFAKKAHLYATEQGSYPAVSTTLTGAGAAGLSYYLTGVTVSGTAITTTAPATPSTHNYYRCGTAAAAAATSLATVTVVTGAQIRYYDYTNSNFATVNVGGTSGNSSAGYNITCYLST